VATAPKPRTDTNAADMPEANDLTVSIMALVDHAEREVF
jgi:hypothetical protein